MFPWQFGQTKMSINSFATVMRSPSACLRDSNGSGVAGRILVSGSDQAEQLVAHLLSHRGSASLDVEPKERFRIGRAEAEPPIVEVDQQTVGVIVMAIREGIFNAAHGGIFVRHLGVDLARVPVAFERRERITEG